MPNRRQNASHNSAHMQVSFSAQRTMLSTDGSASFPDDELQTQSRSQDLPIASAYGPAVKSTGTRALSLNRHLSRGRNDRAPGPSSIPQYRKTRLPWLDGSQSRKGSLPTAPGAYLDESPDQNDDDTTTTTSIPVFSGEYILPHPDRAAPQKPTIERPLPDVTTTGPQSPIMERETSRPALPLIALARELYQTDSSGAMSDSETDISMRGARRRVLGVPAPAEPRLETTTTPPAAWSASPSVPSTVAPGPGRTSRFAEDGMLSPRTPGTRRPTEVERSSSSGTRTTPSGSVERRPSMALQPIRAKKVTITLDDLSPAARLTRQQSLSVQPLRRRGLSRSFQEDLSTDYVRRSRPRSVASQSPAERGMKSSIAGLENLMQEAVQLAKDAADSGRSDEVPGIMNEARLALHRATIEPTDDVHIARVHAKGMKSSGSSSSRSTRSSTSSEGLPIIYNTNVQQPQIHPALRGRNLATKIDGPTSDQASTVRALSPIGAQAVWDEDYPNHRVDPHAKADDPRATDFAHTIPARVATTTTNAATPGLNKGKTREGLQGQQRPPPPTRNPTNTGVPRSTVPTQDQVQEHIHECNEPPIPPRRSSLANQVRLPGILEGTISPEPRSADAENETPNVDPVVSSTLNRRPTANWGRDKYDENEYRKLSDLRGKNHLTLREGQSFSIHHGHRRQPIARNWSIARKRFVATVTCLNTALIGVLIGIYAGEVPAIQYTLADLSHQVILGNVYLYIGMAFTTFFFWPLPLLHGRKPYTLVALGLALPLQIPQAIIVQERRTSVQSYKGYITGLLICRAALGLALGFAHINFKSTLLDLFGSSLQSEFPHGEVVITDDIRRHGGGMGYWLGLWSFTFLGSLSLGFLIGAEVISGLNQAWGFYICVILIALALFINVLTPETRRSPHRRTMQEVELPNDSVSRRVARGEIKMHVSGDGPKWWWEEVFAGVYLSIRMLLQSGFLLMAIYMGWVYAQIVLIIVLLGNLLSAEYRWRPEYVGLGVLGIGIGALLAVPNSKANFFSKSRINPPRTDSMTLQPRFAWTSHLVRRALFMTVLPVAGLAYTLASKGRRVQYIVPIVFAALIGYVSNLAIAECNGIIMENFDTSDLQPGTNSRHRLQSLQANVKQKRTTYTSYPRVSAGIFAAQSIGFLFAAAATGVGGAVTRTVGAQKATAITAGILTGLTLLLICALYRFKVVQVIPNELFGQYFGSADADTRRKSVASMESDRSWRAVIIGNPSGKNRKMSWLELGSLSRWTEIRRLNRLLNRSTTQGLNPGWQ